MPPPPPAIPNDAYAQLLDLLHPSPPFVLEIEILPSTFPPRIQHESPALGVPKSLLIPLHLQARTTFFNHLSSPDTSDSYHAALRATAILLLFDPNHLTAANFRKRHLQRCISSSRERTGNDYYYHYHYDDRDCENSVATAVRRELKFLESLVTSPLGKHAKSSTLWAQRLWVVRSFWLLAVREHAADGAVHTLGMGDGVRRFWDGELVMVMKAGERHARNYYAWQYARLLFSFVRFERTELVGRGHWDGEVLRDSVGLVRGWCLMHPRDISGWAFLVFLLEQLRDEGCGEGGKMKELEDEIGISASETEEFARKYEWKGESIEWFLNAMKTLDIN